LTGVEGYPAMTLDEQARPATLARFVADHGLALIRFAYVLCGDRGRAEDLVQDTYLALYRRYQGELPLDAPVAYARRSIVNGQLSRLRRRSSGETLIGEIPEVPVDADLPDEQDAMWRTLAGLPDRQRAVLVLRYYIDLSDADIAQLLGTKEGTVRSLAARAFARLREHPALLATEEQR
jgi:RNA polymerase sigma-70 factor (sigma-E family)